MGQRMNEENQEQDQKNEIAGNAGGSDSLYDLTVTLHNVGDTLEKYLPQLYVMESEQPESMKQVR